MRLLSRTIGEIKLIELNGKYLENLLEKSNWIRAYKTNSIASSIFNPSLIKLASKKNQRPVRVCVALFSLWGVRLPFAQLRAFFHPHPPTKSDMYLCGNLL